MRFILPVLILGLSLYSYSAHAGTISGNARVIDGDTILIKEESIRLEGIDAPEAGQKCNKRRSGKWACGKDAIKVLSRLIKGKTVTCQYERRGTYGRILGYCSAGGVDLNRYMVMNGHAWLFRKYSSKYSSEELRAQKLKFGVWQAPTQTAWDYRAGKWKVAVQVAPKGCPIKGNINRKKERIYHAPWSPWYTRTKVSLKKGERWFCSEADAIKAGWRAPYWG